MSDKVWSLDKAHEWTDANGEVLILRFVGEGCISRNNFVWPLTIGETVTAPDWDAANKCGGGLHGWPLGLGIGDGKDPDWTATWLVFGCLPADITGNIENGQKCKARTGTIRFVGKWNEATNFVLAEQMKLIFASSRGAASATGERGAASATGERGAASATGWSGAASATGWSGAASATGLSGAASATGERGAASATGESGAASATGESGAASATGLSSKAKAGKFGCIALAYWDTDHQEMRCAEIGTGDGSDGKLKENVWYTLNENGEFVEVA